MKKLIYTMAVVILLGSCTTVKEVPVKVNTQILPLGDTVKLYKGSIVYSLPLTGFEFTVVAQRTVQTAGPYHDYADQFLGLKDVIRSNNTVWTLREVKIDPFNELEPEQYYVIK